MRQIRATSFLLASAVLLAGSAEAQSSISGSGGTVTTDINGAAAVGITATANPASNVKVTLGANSTAAFHIFTSSNTELFRLQSNGYVGIGTISPNGKLDIATASDGITIGQRSDNVQAIQTYLDGHWADRSTYANGCCNLLLLQPDAGSVGIASSSPTSRLEIGTTFPVQFQELSTQGIPNGFLLNMTGNGQINVAGLQLGQTGLPVIQSAGSSDLHLNQFTGASVVVGNSGNTTGLKVQSTGLSTFAGPVTVAGTLTATTVYSNYQDVAEWVPAAGPMPAGTVVVLSDEVANTVTASKRSYDTSVAGVVSPTPGLLLGVEGPSKAKIATTGRVKVRVDASRSPIRIGDLLVTSDRPGMAMKSEPLEIGGAKMHRPGTLIGKALASLPEGEGEILVLLSLQ